MPKKSLKKAKFPKKLKNYQKRPLKKNKKKHRVKRRTLTLMIVVLLLLLLIVIPFLLNEFGLIASLVESLDKRSEKFQLEDECSIIIGQLIHTIDNQDSCENRCGAFCESKEKQYQKAEFAEIQNSCNRCDCYCN